MNASTAAQKTFLASTTLISLVPLVVLLQEALSDAPNFGESMGAWWWAIGILMLIAMWVRLVNVAARFFWGGIEGTAVVVPYERRWLRRAMYGAFARRQTATDMEIRSTLSIGAAFLSVLAGMLGAVGGASINSLVQIISGRNIVAPEILDSGPKIMAALVLFVVVSPLVETAVMAVVLRFGRRLCDGPWRLSLFSAVGWGLLHAATGHVIHFFAMAWLFLILSILYLRLHERHGLWVAVIWTCVAHALNNMVALSLIMINQRVF